MSVNKAPHCGSPIVGSLSCLKYFYCSPWPIMAHSSPAECLWASGVQCASCLVKTLGHCRTKCKTLVWTIYSLPMAKSGSYFTHTVPMGKKCVTTLKQSI